MTMEGIDDDDYGKKKLLNTSKPDHQNSLEIFVIILDRNLHVERRPPSFIADRPEASPFTVTLVDLISMLVLTLVNSLI